MNPTPRTAAEHNFVAGTSSLRQRLVPVVFHLSCTPVQYSIPTTIEEVLNRLAAPHPSGGRYIVTSKQAGGSTSRGHVTTLLDEVTGLFYRAPHLGGLVVRLKHIARESGGRVLFLSQYDRYIGPSYVVPCRRAPRERVELPPALAAAQKGPWSFMPGRRDGP